VFAGSCWLGDAGYIVCQALTVCWVSGGLLDVISGIAGFELWWGDWEGGGGGGVPVPVLCLGWGG